MTKRRRVAGFALLAGVALGLAFSLTRPREPVYQGRPLSAWLAELKPNYGGWFYDRTSDRAREAVRQMGTNALPQIRAMLRTEDSAAKNWINHLLNKQSVIKFRFKSVHDAHGFALLACDALGPAAKEALPELRSHILEPANSLWSGIALGHIGPAAVPLLLEALTNRDASLHPAGAEGLYLLGTNAQAAVPQLLAALNDQDRYARCFVVRAVANLGQDPEIWMPVMLELLSKNGSLESFLTIEFLGEIGSKAKGAVPTLLTLLKANLVLSDGTVLVDTALRELAAEALKKIDPEAATKAGVK